VFCNCIKDSVFVLSLEVYFILKSQIIVLLFFFYWIEFKFIDKFGGCLIGIRLIRGVGLIGDRLRVIRFDCLIWDNSLKRRRHLSILDRFFHIIVRNDLT